MNLHEYQGKSILQKYGVTVQRGVVVEKVEDAVAAAKKLTEDTGTSWYVVKAQIHAGGRGKGVVEETGVGASSFEQAAAKQETHTAAKPPETECKNFDRFIEFYFVKQIKSKFV